MSFLPTAGDTVIYDGQFNNAQTINFYSANPKSREPYDTLKEYVALDALFNSSDRFDPPKCHPETRTAILDHIDRWLKDTASSAPRVLWIRGGAGAGKSAIAQTLSERWYEEGYLAATFYFSRMAVGRNEKKRLIPTIAYQLAIAIPAIWPQIEDLMRNEPDIFNRNLRTQMKKLIIDPLLSVARSVPIPSNVIIIDGLDECCIDYPQQDHEQQQKEILECIHCATIQEGFPFRFLIASRPERQIREIFEHGDLEPTSSRIILDNTQNPAADIELYLRCKLAEIRRIHPHLGPSWPPEEIIAELVVKSSGHFIYVAVVIRYLSAPRINPVAALNTIMDISRVPDRGGPFAELDALYTHILGAITNDSLPTVLDMFRLMIFGNIAGYATIYPPFRDSITRMSPYCIAKHLFTPLGQLYVDLVDLHSILDIPSQKDSKSVPISFLHASFSEFLTQSTRSGQFYIEKQQASYFVLSLFVKHVYYQCLSPEDPDYNEDGFGVQTCSTLGAIEPDNRFVEPLTALLNVDENDFTAYVNRNNLGSSGVTKRNMQPLNGLYNARKEIEDVGNVPTVLLYLKKHAVQEFVPVDPQIFWPGDYQGVLAWFCDTHDERKSRAQLKDRDLNQPVEEPQLPLENAQSTQKNIGLSYSTPTCWTGLTACIVGLFKSSKGNTNNSDDHS